WFSVPAAEELVLRARSAGLAGATVLRGIFGMDVNGNLLETRRWSLVEHVPVIIEFVDSPQAIGRFLPLVGELVLEGMATLERGHVLRYRHKAEPAMRANMRIPQPIVPFSTLPAAEEFPIMKLSEEGQLLRVFIGESDTWQGQPLFRAIVLKARELGLAG